MPSDRKVTAFRPDDIEADQMAFLQNRTGLPAARVLALALRQMAERERYKADWRGEKKTEKAETQS